MTQLIYRSSTGVEISLDGAEVYVGTASELRSRKWAYEIERSSLSSVARLAREASVDAWMTPKAADDLAKVADADMLMGTPGMLVAQGEWNQAAYLVEQEADTIGYGSVFAKLRFVLLEGCWWRTRMQQFAPGSGSIDATGGLDYAHDYEHDYSKSAPGASIDTGSIVPCKPFITFYGSGTGGVVNPYIILGGNKYQVNTTLSAGDRVEIDGRRRTVERILSDGTRMNLFSSALRGSGLGGGEYVFQPIPAGDNALTWDDSFGVDVGWYEEAGEPPWTAS